MNIAEIYEKFDQIGCLTFATVDKGVPQTRIAHLFAYDDDGLYFRTMVTKPFYDQLIKTPKLSICGMFPTTTVTHDKNGMPCFVPGYTIRATGHTREIPTDVLQKKGGQNRLFMVGVKDIERYPSMTNFCPPLYTFELSQ